MFNRDERVLVAVSGGKDSLALWDVLVGLGYETRALPRARHRRVLGALAEQKASRSPRSAGSPLIASRAGRRGRSRCPTVAADAPAGVLRLRHVQAPPLRSRRARARLSRPRHRPQPRRRGGAPARQRAALADCRTWRGSSPVLQPTHPRFVRKVKPLFRTASSRPRPTPSCAASTTSSRSARTPRRDAARLQGHARTGSSTPCPGSKLAFVPDFLRAASRCFAGPAAEDGAAADLRAVRHAVAGESVLVLPARAEVDDASARGGARRAPSGDGPERARARPSRTAAAGPRGPAAAAGESVLFIDRKARVPARRCARAAACSCAAAPSRPTS